MIFKKKVDGVIEGVKYGEDDNIDWVRVYQRRDMAYTDVIILPREELIKELESGKRYKTGQRIKYQGSSFVTDLDVILNKKEGTAYIQAGEADQDVDHLDGVPIF